MRRRVLHHCPSQHKDQISKQRKPQSNNGTRRLPLWAEMERNVSLPMNWHQRKTLDEISFRALKEKTNSLQGSDVTIWELYTCPGGDKLIQIISLPQTSFEMENRGTVSQPGPGTLFHHNQTEIRDKGVWEIWRTEVTEGGFGLALHVKHLSIYNMGRKYNFWLWK